MSLNFSTNSSCVLSLSHKALASLSHLEFVRLCCFCHKAAISVASPPWFDSIKAWKSVNPSGALSVSMVRYASTANAILAIASLSCISPWTIALMRPLIREGKCSEYFRLNACALSAASSIPSGVFRLRSATWVIKSSLIHFRSEGTMFPCSILFSLASSFATLAFSAASCSTLLALAPNRPRT